MARVGRLAGAILAETRGEYYLVGNTKVPCDWDMAGFERPGEPGAATEPGAAGAPGAATEPGAAGALPCRFVQLSPRRPIDIAAPYLTLELEGEALPLLLAQTLVIERTGSVSERLWRLVTGQRDDDDDPVADVIEARWLGEIPPLIWNIVKDAVLRCS